MKRVFSFLIAATITASILTAPVAQAADVKVDYVALGDSLAAGQTPYGTIGISYTDMISDALAQKNMLASFTKKYATSGETSVELLETLKREDVQQSIREAELVTIVSGANDFIQAMYSNGSIDLSEGLALLNTVTANITAAVQNVKALNPEADIYLFGYYFPLPHMEEGETKNQLKAAFNVFNSNLEMVAQNEGIHFVEVASVFDLNSTSYLPNPADIHPNEAGYKVFADRFFLSYDIPVNRTFPDPNGVWGKLMHKTEAVSANKMWTVKMNREVKPDSVPGAIYVVKGGTQLINVETEVSEDKKNIMVKAPVQGYESGSYHLMITDKLTDTTGKPLKTTVLMTFTVQ